jgi:hypothetical protein
MTDKIREKSEEVINEVFILRGVVTVDRPCVLVVRVPGYRSRDPGFDSRRYQSF